MSPLVAAALISAGGLVLSVLCSVFIAGTRWGTLNAQLTQLREADSRHASKEDVANLREQLGEIKGMFRLTLRDSEHI